MTCPSPLPLAALVDYRARADDPAAAAAVEDHVFACDACAARLAALAALADAVASIARAGALGLIATESLLDRLRADGRALRVYRVAPGGHVPCTVKPLDDLVISWLEVDAPPGATVTLDLLAGGQPLVHLDDCPLDHTRGALLVATPAAVLRPLGEVDLLVRLTRDGAPLGDYHFHHAPDRPE
ncbi:MAG: hypothetical protein IT385_05700 [Deltaproteobacteria bacterium]|nr:hypothetical protein [Deltaproteobacteria bacterium]